MEDIKEISVQEAMNLFNRGKTTIYKMMNEGNLKFRDTEEGRIVILSKEEHQNLLNNSSGLVREFSRNSSTKNSTNDNEIIFKLLDKIDQLSQQTIEYAEQAGQVKLLTDNNKFYQEEYFKLKYERDELNKKYNELFMQFNEIQSKFSSVQSEKETLKNNINELEAQIKHLRTEPEQKPSWQFWKK